MDQNQTNQLNQIGNRTRVGPYIAISALCLLFFAVTSPERVPSVVLIAGFLAVGALIYSLLRLGLAVSGLEPHISRAWRRALVLLGTSLPLLLLILQSIGQLTVRDFLTLGGICLLGVFYVSHIHRK